MTIRTFQPGDEVAQVSIYNEAAADLPRFKAATLDEVRRRSRAADFNPKARFMALEQGQPVGYAAFHSSGRLSYPWCRKGYEAQALPLLETVLNAMRESGFKTAFAAYRGDWPVQRAFFLAHGFRQSREMINFVMDLAEMPTPAARPNTLITPLQPNEVAAVFALSPEILRVATAEALARYLLHHPSWSADSCFVLRSRPEEAPVAAGILVVGEGYADPKQVDSGMPCFRLGAFGTENMQTKRINGLFSFLAPADHQASRWGLELLGHAAARLDPTDLVAMAAQVPSDAPHLARFYQHYFRRQGSFPIFEREL